MIIFLMSSPSKSEEKKSKDSAKNSRRSEPQSPSSSPLSNTLLIGLGICVLLSLSANILHADTFSHHDHSGRNSAIARAIKEFKSNAIRSKSAGAPVKSLPRKEKENSIIGHFEDTSVQNDQDDTEEIDPEEIRRNQIDVVSDSRIASLRCDKFEGGPSTSKATEEMVYWHDIPSDAKFVSPFKNTNKNAGRQYLTFDPDGGKYDINLFLCPCKRKLI